MDIVQDIRRSLEVDNEKPSVLSECVERSLELLTDQLYNTDTHFLLEFVQNAEDNEYNESLPTLRIDITDAAIKLSCNEVGFSEHNVRAICKIGASTKKNISRFIGEKGIGFKSVFKIADVVHVTSGPYTFKFDRKQRLGMIAPIWDRSRSSEPGWTTFLLDLSSRHGISKSMLEEMISAIKPSLLLFLTKLRLIELDIKVKESRATRHISIERTDLDSRFIQLTRTEHGVPRSKDMYFMFKRTISTSKVPQDMRRGAENTEIILAFPVDENRRPRAFPQDVHAFLPVRKFGFSFVIQADFLTSSSREDVLHDSPWNVNLRDAIADTFVATIQAFQNQSSLRDIWIRYLPNGIVDPFFFPIERDLLKTLQKMRVVKDFSGVLRRPDEVLRIPSAYRYKRGPLIEEKFMKLWYVSDDYDASTDMPLLGRLGVREMTPEDFLSAIARIGTSYLSSRDNEWHEAVCYELTKIHQRSKKQFRIHLSEARILPLDDGSWAHVRDASEFVFESDVSGIPDHVNFRRIHRRIHTYSAPRQYELYRTLGVRQADLAFIAEKILGFEGRLSVQQHVSNASFFFSNRFSWPELPSPAGRLLVVDESGETDIGEKMYLDLPSDNGLLRCLPPPARFAHSAYIRKFPGRQSHDWLSWLRDKLGLNTSPRLIGMRLSPEFREMMTSSRLLQSLEALKYFWHRLPVRESAAWLKELGQLYVTMDNGSRCTLDSLYLKRGILSKYRGILFAPVTHPEAKDWDFLHWIGVTTEVGAAFFVKVLIQYQSQGMDDEETVKQIYKQLEARFDEDATRIRDAFRNHPLIYVSRSEKGRSWKRMSEAYWNGPRAMTSKIALRDIYPDLGELFQEKLGLADAPPEVLVDELRALAEEWTDKCITQDVHAAISNMIISISSFVKRGRLNVSSAKDLLQHAIFPSHHSETGLRLRKLNDIYIPDYTGYFARKFRGKVILLELSDTESELPSVKYLLELASDDVLHLLEKCVDVKTEIGGSEELDVSLTACYCERYQSFERLVHDNPKHSDRNLDCLSKMKEVAIYTVGGISSKLSIPDVPPISTDAEVLHLREDEDSIKIYVNKSVLGSSGQGAIHLSVCKRLADMLDCKFDLLLLCVSMTPELFDIFLKEKGIGSVGPRQIADYEWMQSNDSRKALPTTSPTTGRPLDHSSARHERSWEVTNTISSQDSFSMKSLESEIDAVMRTIPEFSASSPLLVRPGKLTPATLSRLASSTSPSVATLLSRLPPPSKVYSDAKYSLDGQYSTGDQSRARTRESAPTQASAPSKFYSDAKQSLGGQYSTDDQSRTRTCELTSTQASVVASDLGLKSFVRNFPISQPSLYQEVNGFLGERYVYKLLSAVIGPTFGPQNWTSELRVYDAGFKSFEGKSLADFTYEDREGILTAHLFKDDPGTIEKFSGTRPTYHIEVKSTSSGSREPFSLSKRQLRIALEMLHDRAEPNGGNNVYVLIRVWNVRNPTPTSHAIFVDPLRCILSESLKIVSNKLELMVGE